VRTSRGASIALTTECWLFIHVHALFDATPDAEISGAIPEPRNVVRMTLRQAKDVANSAR
jgi:hypothetical protein